MYQMKEQDNTPEKQLSEVEIGNLPENEFRIMIVKMIQDLRKRMEAKIEKMQDMFNKDLEELKNKQTEMNNTITETKNTLEGIYSRIIEAGTSMVAQWLRIHLPMQGTRVRALVREDPTCHRATKVMHHNY